jgi:Fe-S cluster assembly protein SufD
LSSLLLEGDALQKGFRRVPEGPASIEALRRDARERFAALGFPTPRDEAWRYTSVAPILKTRFAETPPSSPPTLEEMGLSFLSELSPTLVRDGRCEPRSGVTSLARALGSPEVEKVLGHVVSFRDDAFAALNTAFLEDGALVTIPRKSVASSPVVVVHGTSTGRISHPRTLVVAEEGSEGTLIEVYASRPGEVSFTHAVTEVVLGEGASLDVVRVQAQSEAAFHVERLGIAQARASRIRCRNFVLGSALFRSDIVARFEGPGGELDLDGLFLARGSQHMDTSTRIIHAEPHCTSREVYKGILSGRARGIFQGTILVERAAQKTDAQQTNRNLLLSRGALVNSIPRLEILADDVKCKHGSATGRLDPDALFYLRARGLDEHEAQRVLVSAFGQDLVQKVRTDTLRLWLTGQLGSRLGRTGEGDEA